MAQTGYTPILIYSSSTASNAPAVGNLTNSTLGSELAINITDGKLFYKDNANAIQVIAWKVTPTTAGGTGLISYAQGDLLYYNSGTTLTALAKSTTATRYLSNTGTNNNPAWAQINLANGVTGTLPTGNGGTGLTTFTANGIVYASSTSALATGSVLTFDGTNFAIGGTPGVAKSLVIGPDQTTANVITSANTDLEVSSTGTSVASGGSIIFGAASGAWKFAAIKALATNGGNNTQGSLAISTRRVSTDAALTEAIRFHASGGISINSGTDPTVGNLALGTGNLVISTSGKGIDFSAAGGDVLSTYDEGTWTPSDQSGAGLTFTSADGWFVRVGREVFAHYYITYPVTASVAANVIGGLPFTAGNTNAARGGSALTYNEFNAVTSIYGPKNTTLFALVDGVGNQKTNATMSGKTIMGCINYFL